MMNISPLLCFSLLLVTRALINQPFLWESSAKPNLTGDQSAYTVYDHSHPRWTTQPDALSPFQQPFSRYTWVSRYQNVSILHFIGVTEVVLTTAATWCAKLQSNHHHQQTNTRCTHTRLQSIDITWDWSWDVRQQWRRNRGFRRFNEPGSPSSWGPRVVGPQKFFKARLLGKSLKLLLPVDRF